MFRRMAGVFALNCLAISCALAAEVPKDIHGRWSSNCKMAAQAKKSTGTWSGIVVKKSQIEWDSQICKPTKTTVNGNKVVMEMNCTPMGDEDFKASYAYELNGDVLKESSPGQKWENSYKRCP